MKKLLIFFACLLLAACQGESKAEEEAQHKIKVENGEETVIVEQAPQRAITMNQHVTEIMLALGLEDRMVGTAYLDDGIHPDYQEAYKSVPVLSDTDPSKESILAVEPDFIYAGWESAFQNEAAGNRQALKEYGIASYLQESSNMVNPQLEDLFRDIRNIGTLFEEEEAADQLIEEMTAEINEAKQQIPKNVEPKKVFVYDSGEDAPYTAAQNMLNTLIETAGADNIFSDVEKGWASVSWEDAGRENPDEIIIIDYGETSTEDKKAFLEKHPVMKHTTAVKNEEYTVIPLSEASEGIRIPEAFQKVVEGLYN